MENEDKELKEQQGEEQAETKSENTDKESQKGISRAELGSIVSAQLAKARKEWEAETEQKIAKAKQDGKDEATLSAKELAEKHSKEREEELTKREQDLNKRLADLERRDHIAHTKDLLSEQHLPTGIAEMVLGETEEETKSNIDQYRELVDQGVRNQLHRSSAQEEPKNGSGNSKAPEPTKNMADMNYEEMQKFIESQQQ